MYSREKILTAIKTNQPSAEVLPEVVLPDAITFTDKKAQFTAVLKGIGGTIVEVTSVKEIVDYLHNNFRQHENFVTTLAGLEPIKLLDETRDAHFLENIEVAIIPALFGIAENGSVWITEQQARIRALPFICQHLAVVLKKDDFVNNMHEAYDRIGLVTYDFGVFIAGPSKTADIEQSLVLGAHGPKTMTVFITG